MSSRRDVLRPFLDQKSYMEDRIAQGIETGRKGYGRLIFQDSDGKPVLGGTVTLRQKSHEFRTGANLFMLDEFDSREQNELYRQRFAEAFNLATLPFYWKDLEPEQGKPRYSRNSPRIYRRPPPDLCLDFCESQDIMPKAHCLNYVSMTPDWAKGDIHTEKMHLVRHFRELAGRYAHQIRDWEVTNETFWGCRKPGYAAIYDADDLVEWSFQTAGRYFPENRLIINEAHCRIWNDAHYYGSRSPYFMQIERALRNGAPVDSIGMQFHMFIRAEDELEQTKQYYSPGRIYDVLDTYAKLGRPLQITELTIPAYAYTGEDEEIQAEIMRRLYSIWFSHPAMEAVIYWNLVDGFAAYAPKGDMTAGENYYHGGLIRYDFTPKPAFNLLKELFTREWHTELKLENQSGQMEFKGFFGTYDLTVEQNGNKLSRELFFGKNSNRQIIVRI